MRKLTFLLTCLFLIGIGMVNAQSKVISGKVISADDGQPIIGATVQVKGTQTGVITDVDGNFSISVPASSNTLVVKYVGMKTIEVMAKNHMTIKLQSTALQINEVVVTALGIKRSERSIGYAATTVSSADLMKAKNSDVATALSGKVAGLQIQSTSSDPGSAATVTIRGFSSINSSNQPLYVVDGVPIQNTTISDANLPSNIETGHAINVGGVSNISPDDIASMTVLKGAAATALYGSRAANGVIVITTKQGKKGNGKNFSIRYNGGLKLSQISVLPTMQNEFGQGWDGRQTYIENGSWGPKLNGSTQVYGPIWNNEQLIHTYSALKNNVLDFFDIGKSLDNNISISGASNDQSLTYYLSYSNSNNNGIMPTDADSYDRNTFAYNSSFKATDWFKISSSMNFATAKTNTVGSFQGTSVIDGLYEMPRDVSIVDHKDLSSAFNTPEAYFTPYGITNPYWALANNYNQMNSKQVYGKIQADIKPMKDLTITYRFGYDYTDYDTKIGYPQISLTDALINEDYGYAPKNMNQAGYVYASYGRKYELNHDFMATYDKKFDIFSVTAIAGLNVNERASTMMQGETNDLSINTGFWDLSNGSQKTVLGESQWKRRLIGVYGDVTLGYKDMLYLDVTARNDWSSTLPINKNNYFYPGATLSWDFSQLLPKNNVLSFGKLRLAYGKTGNDANPYYTGTQFMQAYANGYYGTDIASFPMNGTNSFIASNTAGSNTLSPEMTSEGEFGFNLQFFEGRLGLDASYYNRITSNQIFDLPADPSSGYSSIYTNFGEVQNHGIELLLNTTPVKTKNIRWDLSVNFAINRNKVLSMPASLEGGKVQIYRFAAGNDAVYMYAEKGKPLGTYYTYLPEHVTDKSSPYYGDIIVDENGQPKLSTEVQSTGLDINHKWTGGLTSTFTAYGVSLSATLDVRYGGTMFSRTKNLMEFTGNGIITTYNDRRPFVIPNSVQVGTDSKGNTVYTENSTELKLTNDSYQKYYDLYGWGNGGESYLVNRSFAKLRNISISYELPKKWLNPIYLSSLSVSAYVNNAFVWTAADNYYIDPESSTTGTGLQGMFGELYTNPASRTYGFNLSITY